MDVCGSYICLCMHVCTYVFVESVDVCMSFLVRVTGMLVD